jgi:hypothetical protein
MAKTMPALRRVGLPAEGSDLDGLKGHRLNQPGKIWSVVVNT